MKKLGLILLLAALVIAPPAAGQYFRAQHWLVSTVNDSLDVPPEPADGKIGMAYKVTGAIPPYTEDRANPANPKDAIVGNTLMINAFALPGGWTVGEGVRMEVPESTSGYKAGPVPIPPGAPYYTTALGFDDVGTMTLISSVPVIGGPQLYLKAYLQGYYSPGTGTSRGAMVAVEAYSGTGPTALVNLKGKTVIRLDENGVGHNGLSSDGTPAGTLIGPGSYYLVIRHKLPDIAAGPNHMPVVTAIRVPIPTAVPTAPFDITDGDPPDTGASPIDTKVWRTSAADPRYEYPMFPETGGKFSLKGGFSDGFDPVSHIGDIGSADFQLLANPSQWEKSLADGANPRSDLDGDGFVGSADFQMMAHPKNWETRTSVPYLP